MQDESGAAAQGRAQQGVALALAGTAALLWFAGYAYLTLVGAAAALVVLPRRWEPLGPLVAPLLGWAVLAVAGYWLAIVLPFTVVVPAVGSVAGLTLLTVLVRNGCRWTDRRANATTSPNPSHHPPQQVMGRGSRVAAAASGDLPPLAQATKCFHAGVDGSLAGTTSPPGPLSTRWRGGGAAGGEVLTSSGTGHVEAFSGARRLTGRPWPGAAAWREASWSVALAAASYAVGMAVYVRQGYLAMVVVDRDAERYYDTVASLLRFPLGWRLAAVTGLEGTPVGPPYYVVHGLLSALTGLDTYTTALPSHLLMISLAVPALYLFARTAVRLSANGARLASGLYALGGGTPLIVASFGFPHQVSALAAVPFGVAALTVGLTGGSARGLWVGGLGVALASLANYPVTVPLMAVWAVALAVGIVWEHRDRWGRAPGGNGATWEELRGTARRLVMIGLVAVVCGAPTHLTLVDYVAPRLRTGLVDAGEIAQRSVHVSTFASLAGALGVAPLDLFRDVQAQNGVPLLRWVDAGGRAAGAVAGLSMLAGVAGFGLLAAGLTGAVRRRVPALALVAGIVPFFVYFRAVKPFPYWEFKLITAVWFLVPCFAALGAAVMAGAAGAAGVPRGRQTPGHAGFPFPSWGTGIASMGRWRRVWPAPAGRRAASVAAVAVACFGVGLVLVQVHAARVLSLPWGGGLPEREVAAARQVVRATLRGSSVYVSAQLTPLAARQWEGVPIHHARGSPSPSGGAAYLSQRWRGVVTTMLAYGDRPVYGVLRRDTNDLVLPADPRSTGYVLLDEAEDPRLYGVLPSSLVVAAGTLRLYHQEASPAAVVSQQVVALKAPEDAAPDPSVLLDVRATGTRILAHARTTSDGDLLPAGPTGPAGPVRPSLPPPQLTAQHLALAVPPDYPRRAAQLERVGAMPWLQSGSGTGVGGNLVLGFQAVVPVRLTVSLRDAGGEDVRREEVVLPGLTWYTTPAMRWPADVRVAVASPEHSGEAVRPVGIITVNAAPGEAPQAERLERSASGTVWPLLTVVAHEAPDGASVTLDAWYSYDGPREGTARAQLRDTPERWSPGSTPLSTLLHLGPGHRIWRVVLRPGSEPEQWSSEGRALTSAQRPWSGQSGPHWLWLEMGPHGDVQLHEPVVTEVEVADGRLHVDAAPVMATTLPLLAEPVAPPPVVDGTLVKGQGEELFYVDRGRLRWVSSVDALERNHIPWRLTLLGDAALRRLPVALPLT